MKIKIYYDLEEINIPTPYSRKGVQGHHHAEKTGTTNQEGAIQTIEENIIKNF